MSTKWKYATLPASARIDLLRKGRRDVLEEEIARTAEVVKARRELGLDTSEQEKWMDTVGYSYNLAHAREIGESEESVAKEGYARLYLDGKKTGTPKSDTVSQVHEYRTSARPKSSEISNAKRKIERAGEMAIEAIGKRYADKAAELESAFYGESPTLREAVLNSGGHDDGGKMASAYRAKATELGAVLDGKSEAMEKEISKSRQKYAELVETLLGYRKNGAAKESLDTIADVLIKNAALEDGYDPSPITGKPSRISVKAIPEITSDKAPDTSTPDPLPTYVTPDKVSRVIPRTAEARAKAAADTSASDTSASDTTDSAPDPAVTKKSPTSDTHDTTPEVLTTLLVDAAKRLGKNRQTKLLDYLTTRLGIDKKIAEGLLTLILDGNG